MNITAYGYGDANTWGGRRPQEPDLRYETCMERLENLLCDNGFSVLWYELDGTAALDRAVSAQLNADGTGEH